MQTSTISGIVLNDVADNEAEGTREGAANGSGRGAHEMDLHRVRGEGGTGGGEGLEEETLLHDVDGMDRLEGGEPTDVVGMSLEVDPNSIFSRDV